MEDQEILRNICSQSANFIKLNLTYNIDQTSLNQILRSVVNALTRMVKTQNQRIDQIKTVLVGQVDQIRQENQTKWAQFNNSSSMVQIQNTNESVKNIQQQNITETVLPSRQQISTSTDKKMAQHSTVNIVRLPAQKDKNTQLAYIEERLKKVQNLISKPKENIKRTSLVSREAATDKKLEIVRGVMLTQPVNSSQQSHSSSAQKIQNSTMQQIVPTVPAMPTMPMPTVLPSIRQQISQQIQTAVENTTAYLSQSLRNLSIEQSMMQQHQQTLASSLQQLQQKLQKQLSDQEESNKQWRLELELQLQQQQVANQNEKQQLEMNFNNRIQEINQLIKQMSTEVSSTNQFGNVSSASVTRLPSHHKLNTQGSQNPQKKRQSSVQRANHRVEVLQFHLNTVREQVKGVKDEVATVRRTCDRISTKHSQSRETSSRGFLPKLYKIEQTKQNKENISQFSQNQQFSKQVVQLNAKLSDLAQGAARLSVKIKKIQQNYTKFHQQFLDMERRLTNNASTNADIDNQRLRNQILEILNRCLTDPFDNQFTQHLKKQINSRFIQIKHEYKEILRDVEKKVQSRADLQQLSRLSEDVKTAFDTLKALLAKKQDLEEAKQNNKFVDIRLKQLTNRVEKRPVDQVNRDCSLSIYSRK